MRLPDDTPSAARARVPAREGPERQWRPPERGRLTQQPRLAPPSGCDEPLAHPGGLIRTPAEVAQLNERLGAITSQLLVSQEAERKRIAAELHDGLGQTLSLLRFEIEGCVERAAASDDDRQGAALRRTFEHVQRALQELREITRNLMPAVINDLGLIGSLELLCSEFRAVCPKVKLRVELKAAEGRLPDELAVAIYRISQEALRNIARHADAREALLVLATGGGGVELLIRDDGVGLPADGRPRRGLGLLTMRERVESLGGRFQITGAADKGCSVRASWAL